MNQKLYVADPVLGAWRLILGAAVWLSLAMTGLGQSSKPERPAAGAPAAHSEAEPSAPDVLDLVVIDGASAGSVTLDAVVKPSVDSLAELEIDDPGGAKLQSGGSTKRFTLRRGDAQNRERVQVDVSDGKPRTVKVTLRLLGADGKPWLIVNRQLQLNQPHAEAGEQRVPVVQTLPDGTRIVEYISQKEARSREGQVKGKQAPSTSRPPSGESQKK